MISRVQAVILKRRTGSGDSLYVDVLLETGQITALKIPGILKSNKRSAFHYSAGALYDVHVRIDAPPPVIPRSMELLFSPFTQTQDYARLKAVAEIIELAETLEAGHEAVAIFTLIAETIKTLPQAAEQVELHLDAHYWHYLELMGLAGEHSAGEEYAAYDLQSGFLTHEENARRTREVFILPYSWVMRATGSGSDNIDAALCRQAIRQFLKQI